MNTRSLKYKPLLCELLESRRVLTVLTGNPNAAFESNDTLDSAASLGLLAAGEALELEARLGNWNGSSITNATDVDIFALNLRAGDAVTLDIDAARLDDGGQFFDPEVAGDVSNADLTLHLFQRQDDSYSTLAKNTNAIAPGDATNDNTLDPAIVDFMAPSTGTYFVAVSGVTAGDGDFNPLTTTGRRTSARTGQYRLAITTQDDDNRTPDVIVQSPTGTDGDNNAVSWTISDASGIASSTAQIFTQNRAIFDGPVPLTGSFELDAYGKGDYKIEITATDADTDWAGDQLTKIQSVLFTIGDDDSNPPEITITAPNEIDGEDNEVEWQVSDSSGFEVITAQVWQNGDQIFNSNIEPNSGLDLNSFGIGTYRIQIDATDADNDSVNDQLSSSQELSFTISDDDRDVPSIQLGDLNNIDGEDNVASWDVRDNSGLSSVAVAITQDGVSIHAGEVDAVGSFDLNSFGPGVYGVAISATDADQDWLGDQLSNSAQSVEITISDDDTSAPTIDINVPDESDGVNNLLTWDVRDASGVSGVSALITKDGQTILDLDRVASPFDIVDLNSFGVGEYEVTVSATDSDDDWSGDQLSTTTTVAFTIVDDDTSVPDVVLTAAADSDGEDNVVSWQVTDASRLLTVSAQVMKNGESIIQSNVNAVGEIDLNQQGPGTYLVIVSATDADADWTGDELTVTRQLEFSIADDDTMAPAITLTAPAESDGIDNVLSWDISDVSGVASATALIQHNGSTLFNSDVDAVGQVDLNSYAPGTYQVTVTATDGDGDWNGDQQSSTSTIEFTIADDDTTAPAIEITAADQTDGDDNIVGWNVTDSSGVASVSTQVWRNELPILNSELDPVDSFDVNSFGPGSYRILVTATDADVDWSGDQQTASAEAAWTITDDDVQPPVISIASGSLLDGGTESATWEVTDTSGLATVTASITKGGESIFNGEVEANDGMNLSSLGPGVYRVTIVAIDADTDWSSDSLSASNEREFTILDDDTAAPVIEITPPNDVDGLDNQLSWSISDESGFEEIRGILTWGERVVLDGQIDPQGSVDLNGIGIGDFTFAVTATDADLDLAGDNLVAQRTESFSIIDDDVAGPVTSITVNGTTDGVANSVSWATSDQSGIERIGVVISKDGQQIHAADVERVGSFNLDEFGFGEFTIAVNGFDADNDWVGDRGGRTEELSFSITDDDRTPPVIVVGDFNGVDGETNAISWDVRDPSGVASTSVVISKGDQTLREGAADALGQFNVDEFGPGTYQVTVAATDADSDSSTDETSSTSRTVEFTVTDDDVTAPAITIAAPNGSDGANNVVGWTVTDPSGLASVSTTILQDGESVLELSGDAKARDTFDLNALGIGDYQITVSATDADNDFSGDSMSETATLDFSITDDDAVRPTLNLSSAGDTDGADNTASWQVTDASGLAAVNAQVLKNNDLIFESSVSNSGTVELDQFGPGSYMLFVSARDADRDWVGDHIETSDTLEFTITDDDTAPPSISITPSLASDGENNVLAWQVTDDSGLAFVNATIMRDGESIVDGRVGASEQLDLNAFAPGSYQVTISATDADRDFEGDALSATSTAEFTITDDDQADPEIAISTTDTNDGENNTVSWAVSDASGLAAVNVQIRRDALPILDQVADADGSVDVNTFGPGVYQIAVTAADADTDWEGDQRSAAANSEWTITDDDVLPPSIEFDLGGIADGSGSVLVWSVTDASGLASSTLTLSKAGSPVFTGSVDAAASIDLVSFGEGDFEVALTATDGDNDWVGDSLTSTNTRQFTFADDDKDPPVVEVSTPNSVDGFDNVVSWSINDASGLASQNGRLTWGERVIFDGPIEPVDSIDLNGVGIGEFSLTIVAIDADNDTPDDQATTTLRTDFTITDDDVSGPVVNGRQNGTTDGETNTFSWEITDESGLERTGVRVFKDGQQVWAQDVAPNASVNLDEFGLGEFRIEINAFDADNDWVGDRSGQTEVFDFVIADDDADAPQILITPATETQQGAGATNAFAWTITDAGSGIASAQVKVERLGVGGFVTLSDEAIQFAGTPATLGGESSVDDQGLGQYRLTITATDADGEGDGDSMSTQVVSTLIVVDDTPPQLTAATDLRIGAFDQLGMVNFEFSEDVSQSLDPSDLELRNLTTDEVFALPDNDFMWDPINTSASVDLSNLDLTDKGLYALVLKSTGISDRSGNQLDGDNDGVAGGEYLFTMPITWKGDTDRDLDVDFADFLTVSANFGSNGHEWSGGDFGVDRRVDFDDFLWVSWNFGNNGRPGEANEVR